MERAYIHEEKFERTDFNAGPLGLGDYENCQFDQCNFQNADLSGIHFSDCQFNGCNLSMVRVNKTAFQNIQFTDCKMVGLHFEHCIPLLLSFGFQNCELRLSSFFKLKLSKTLFKHCGLQEVDFVDTDLKNSIFDQCDFTGAMFENTNLESADLRSSFNYSINPEINKIKKAKFSLPAVVGLLDKYGIEID